MPPVEVAVPPGVLENVLAAVPRVHRETGVERLEGVMVALTPSDELHFFKDPETGEVSEVAERIIELADGKRRVREIVDVLCEEFDVERTVCEADTARFVELLVKKKVLEI